MTSTKKKRHGKPNARPKSVLQPAESRVAEAVTVCWTVTLTTLVLTHLVTLIAHLYVASHPEAQRMAMLGGMMHFSGAVVGAVSLALLPLVYGTRKMPPPRGLAVFGACLALAPVLVAIVKLVQ